MLARLVSVSSPATSNRACVSPAHGSPTFTAASAHPLRHARWAWRDDGPLDRSARDGPAIERQNRPTVGARTLLIVRPRVQRAGRCVVADRVEGVGEFPYRSTPTSRARNRFSSCTVPSTGRHSRRRSVISRTRSRRVAVRRGEGRERGAHVPGDPGADHGDGNRGNQRPSPPPPQVPRSGSWRPSSSRARSASISLGRRERRFRLRLCSAEREEIVCVADSTPMSTLGPLRSSRCRWTCTGTVRSRPAPADSGPTAHDRPRLRRSRAQHRAQQVRDVPINDPFLDGRIEPSCGVRPNDAGRPTLPPHRFRRPRLINRPRSTSCAGAWAQTRTALKHVASKIGSITVFRPPARHGHGPEGSTTAAAHCCRLGWTPARGDDGNCAFQGRGRLVEHAAHRRIASTSAWSHDRCQPRHDWRAPAPARSRTPCDRPVSSARRGLRRGSAWPPVERRCRSRTDPARRS